MNAGVEIVPRQLLESAGLVEMRLLIGPTRNTCVRHPRVAPVPWTVQNAVFRIHKSVEREVKLTEVRAVPFQDIWYGTETVVRDVQALECRHSKHFVRHLQQEVVTQVYVGEVSVLEPRHGNGEQG